MLPLRTARAARTARRRTARRAAGRLTAIAAAEQGPAAPATAAATRRKQQGAQGDHDGDSTQQHEILSSRSGSVLQGAPRRRRRGVRPPEQTDRAVANTQARGRPRRVCAVPARRQRNRCALPKKCFAVVKGCSGDETRCERARQERRAGTAGDTVPSGLRASRDAVALGCLNAIALHPRGAYPRPAHRHGLRAAGRRRRDGRPRTARRGTIKQVTAATACQTKHCQQDQARTEMAQRHGCSPLVPEVDGAAGPKKRPVAAEACFALGPGCVHSHTALAALSSEPPRALRRGLNPR